MPPSANASVAASSTTAFLASRHGHGKAATDLALVHGFSVAYWWAVAFLALSALFSVLAVNAPRPDHSTPSADAEVLETPAPVH